MWGVAQRGWWSFGLVVVGCVAQFPTFTEDAGSTGPQPDTRGDADAPADAPSLPTLPDDAAPLIRDAGSLDALPDGRPPAPDAAPPVPLKAKLEVFEFGAALPCGRRDVHVSWTATGALGCAMRTLPVGVFDAPALASAGERLLIGLEEPTVTFVLTCRSIDGGSVEQVADLRQATNLPPQTMFPNRDRVRAEQRRCAAALGQALISNAEADAGFVNLDSVSADQVCRCVGYGCALNFMQDPGRANCFASARDNTIGRYESGGPSWLIREARPTDDCIDTLLCGAPVEYCDALIVSLPPSP